MVHVRDHPQHQRKACDIHLCIYDLKICVAKLRAWIMIINQFEKRQKSAHVIDDLGGEDKS